MACALPRLLLEMSINEVLNVTRIYSVPGPSPPETLLLHLLSFQSPHHTRSLAGLVGSKNLLAGLKCGLGSQYKGCRGSGRKMEIRSAPHWCFYL
jgi:predicted ATPase with chaperone activity